MAQIRLIATVLKQKNVELYLFAMNSAALLKLCYVTPKSKDDLKEVQRVFKEARAKDIAKFVQLENSLLPNAIVLDLTEEVTIEASDRPDQRIITFPSEDGKYAYVLDGQHRLKAFEFSSATQFDLPVVALHKAPAVLRGRVFADINSKQVTVESAHLLQLYYEFHELSSEESATMDIVASLHDDQDSPLCQKIKIMDGQKGTWVTNKQLKNYIGIYTRVGGILSGKPSAQQMTILKEYLKAVKQLWPDAHESRKDYALWKSMGLELVMGVFDLAKQHCDLHRGFQYTSANFCDALKPLVDAELVVPGGGTVALDWRRGRLAPFANNQGRKLLLAQMRDKLVKEADNQVV